MVDAKSLEKYYKHYMGQYFCRPSDALIEKAKAMFPDKMPTAYCVGKPDHLKEVGAFFLLNWGQVRNKALTTYRFVEKLFQVPELGEEESLEQFYDDKIPLLMVYHTLNCVTNKQLYPTVKHCLDMRRLASKPTLFLMETDVKEIRDAVVETGGVIWDISGALPRRKSKKADGVDKPVRKGRRDPMS